jgi:hypothetical protein
MDGICTGEREIAEHIHFLILLSKLSCGNGTIAVDGGFNASPDYDEAFKDFI